ncbi:hypothetical protein [Sphingomicrobium astaxanthinifaciens]|uniref:hypothetical protein n=1 Tax=Sphingomicrobium astaxanthinifaciens TaxID=1227949 RepID=UPI001FCC7296|nr:hypothetical protein [Sphingomicrobium astaxanthinifaciens]MCJ7420395.1 hypothetical protein [Sphingomicrobium astaxanthinifaciens]
MMRFLTISLTTLALCFVTEGSAHAQNKGRASGFQDLNFGLISNPAIDAVRSLDLCVYSSTSRYSVMAYGSAGDGAFALAGPGADLPFEVEWAQAGGVSSGTTLSPNVPMGNQFSEADHKHCKKSSPSTASLIVRLRSTALKAAPAGDYSGTLSVVVAVE